MSHVDWDLLADHLGGALAGTPEGARVARLVATDPSWARAAGELSAAFDAVSADLVAVGPPPAMPGDIAARLDAVLQDLPAAPPPKPPSAPKPPYAWEPATAASPATAPESDPWPAPATAIAARPGASPAGTLSASPPGTPTATTGPAGRRPGRGRSRRRALRWGAGAAAAAGVVAVAALGLGSLGLLSVESPTGGSDAEMASAPDASGDGQPQAPPPAISQDQAAPPMVASGLDYQPGSPLLRTAPRAPVVDTERALTESGDDGSEAAGAEQVPGGLDRVWADPQPCLAAVAAAHDPGPSEITKVDFALFEGDPAVVIWVTAGDGSAWVWVAGPDCGTPAAGPDERYQSRLR